MEYKKYKLEHYNLHIIKTNKFKTISIRINLKNKLNKENVIERIILSKILILINSIYKDERELTIANEELFNPRISLGTNKSGFYNLFNINATFLNENLTEKDMNLKTIEFINNLIFNIDFESEQFIEALDRTKRALYDDLISIKENPAAYSSIRMRELMDKDSLYAIHPFLLIDKIKDVDKEDIKKAYNDMINNDEVDIFIIGDIDNNIKDMLDNLPFKNKETHAEEHTVICTSFKEKENIIIEPDKNTQSKLNISLKLKDITEFERNYIVGAYNYILGGTSTSKLFKNVREKHSLCYFINSSFNANYDILEIHAGIDKKNFDLALKLIKEELENMKNGDFTEEIINNAKTGYINSLDNLTDSPISIINLYSSKEYYNTDLVDERRQKVNTVNKDMIVELSKKIYIDTVYLLEGNAYDKE